MNIKFKRMRPDATIPSFGHGDDTNAGLDLHLVEDCEIGAFAEAWLPTGIAWEPCMDEHGFLKAYWKPALLIRPRSSMAKRGLDITEGTVDAGYRGEIMIHVRNRTPLRADLKAGDRIAQAVPVLLPSVVVEEADELSDSLRGSQGFGSSGR